LWIGTSTVLRRHKVESRLIPRFISRDDDLRDVAESNDDAIEATEVVVTEDVFVGCCCSLELSDGEWVDWEDCEGGGRASMGLEVKLSPPMLLVTISSVVFWSWGTLMPRLSAIRRNFLSTSSSDRPFSNRRTIIL